MSTDPARFDPAQPYTLAGSVALRPEPFGALAYDYTTRRLSFLKTPQLVAVVRDLGDRASAAAAVDAAEVPAAERDRYLRALAGLFDAGIIRPRTANHSGTES